MCARVCLTNWLTPHVTLWNTTTSTHSQFIYVYRSISRDLLTTISYKVLFQHIELVLLAHHFDSSFSLGWVHSVFHLLSLFALLFQMIFMGGQIFCGRTKWSRLPRNWYIYLIIQNTRMKGRSPYRKLLNTTCLLCEEFHRWPIRKYTNRLI